MVTLSCDITFILVPVWDDSVVIVVFVVFLFVFTVVALVIAVFVVGTYVVRRDDSAQPLLTTSNNGSPRSTDGVANVIADVAGGGGARAFSSQFQEHLQSERGRGNRACFVCCDEVLSNGSTSQDIEDMCY